MVLVEQQIIDLHVWRMASAQSTTKKPFSKQQTWTLKAIWIIVVLTTIEPMKSAV